jgi:hypothetical protein
VRLLQHEGLLQEPWEYKGKRRVLTPLWPTLNIFMSTWCLLDCPEYAKFNHIRFQAFPRVMLRPPLFCSVLHHTPGFIAGRLYSCTSTPYTILWCGTLLSTQTTHFTLQEPNINLVSCTCLSLVEVWFQRC